MATCSGCGNDYAKSFEIIFAKKHYTFDCFECAIHTLAPICETCGCKILGHGIEMQNSFFCCKHCAEKAVINANAKLPS